MEKIIKKKIITLMDTHMEPFTHNGGLCDSFLRGLYEGKGVVKRALDTIGDVNGAHTHLTILVQEIGPLSSKFGRGWLTAINTAINTLAFYMKYEMDEVGK